ncbi:MAG: hypothetical protein J0M12_05245 [Deltaproteobacteria bacterium]|nr:hypothetical protein [Deltaproteobacteria bacterium]
MKYFSAFRVAAAALLCVSTSAHALTIDDFNGVGSIQPQPGGTEKYVSISDPGAIGGARGIEGKVTFPLVPGGGDMFVETSDGRFSHSLDSNVSGYSRLSWDGDQDAVTLVTSGLNGIDFLQDNGSAIAIDVVAFDYPSQKPLTLKVTLFDAIDGTRFSTGSVTLNGWVIAPTTFTIPFIAFVADPAASGPVDFTNIGAITLKIDSEQAPAADLQLEWIGTNGICRLVPDQNGEVIDQCGVCGGDGTSCLDCNGIPFGGAVIDQCGVCGGDGSSCLDCNGVPNGDAIVDRCGVCNGDGNSCITCTDKDLTPISVKLDSGAKKLEAAIKRVAQKYVNAKNTPAVQKSVKKILAEVHRLQITNWTLSWVFPRKLTVCDNEAICTYTSYRSTADEYRVHNDEMLQLGLGLVKKLKKLGKSHATVAKQLQRPIEKQYQANLDESYVVPIKDFHC